MRSSQLAPRRALAAHLESFGDGMKTQTKEIFRWIAIAAFGGFGVWAFIYGSYDVITRADGHWVGALVTLGFLGLFAIPFYLVAYICFRRQYRELFRVLGVVASIVVFSELFAIQRQLHVFDYFDRHLREMPWLCILGIPVSLVCLFGPFYAAQWVLRFCIRLAQRRTDKA